MAESADIKVVHETRASQPEGCVPFLPGETLAYSAEVALRVYGPATLEAGVCVLHREGAHHVVGHLLSQTQPHPHTPSSGGEESMVNKQPGAGAEPPAPKQGHSLESGASL